MDLDHLLKDKFRLEQFRPGQRESIEAIMSGRDVLLVLPTGGGKSLCYQLPALASDGLVLVISPLIALMKDQVDGLNALGIPATFINSSISQTEQRSRIDGMRLGQFRLVYVAPERFRSPIFRKAVAEASLSLVAVDESHCVSQWGHDFRPDFLKIKDALERLGRPPTMALTATATPEVRQDIELQLGLRKPLVKVTGFDRPNLNFEVRRIGSQEAKMEMLHKHFSGNTKSGIVYCSAIKRVNEVAEYLQKNQVRALPYHSQIDLGLRHQYQERFMTGETQVMVATNAFGLGIDKHNIRSVIHLNIPATLEAYYQEAGRGGRDGADSDAILLYTYNDRFTQEFLIKNSYPPREDIEMVYQYLARQTDEPIQKTASRMEEELGGRITDKAVYSTLVILEQAEVIERLSGRDTLAWITFRKEPSAAAAREGTIRYRLVEHMLEWGSCEPGERMGFSLDGLSEAAGLQEPQVRRTLHEMEHEGIIDYQPPFRGRGVRMLSKGLKTLAGVVDFDLIDSRREHELDKLETLLKFCQAKSCRRAWLLKYFGEKTGMKYCGNCDWCHKQKKGKQVDATAPVTVDESEQESLRPDEVIIMKKLLSCVARMQGRFGRSMVVNVVRGSKSKRVQEFKLDALSTYGLLKDLSRDEVAQVFELLDTDGCIKTAREFRQVSLTARGIGVMKGEIQPGFRSLGLESKEAKSERKGEPGQPDEDSLGFDEDLYRALRELRYGLSVEEGVPPYMVFNDRALREMSRTYPTDEAAMLEVKGVGQRTMARWGGPFLSAINNFVEQHGTPHLEQPQRPGTVETQTEKEAPSPATAPIEISQSDIDFYEENGFWTGPKILDDDVIAELRNELERVFTDGRDFPNYGWQGPRVYDLNSPRIRQYTNGWWINEAVRRAIHTPSIGYTGARLMGTTEVRVWHDQVLWKPSAAETDEDFNEGNVGWHQDYAHWQCSNSTNMCTAWIALQDIEISMGPMRFVKGSHKWGLFEDANTFGQKDLESLKAKFSDERDWQEEPVLLKAGHASFHHALTFHGSGRNSSSAPRLSLVMHMMPKGCGFKSNGRHHLCATLLGPDVAEGTPFDGKFFPKIWPV